jgi:predicted nucleotidyltransferase
MRMRVGRLEIAEEAVKAFCDKWGVAEFSIFGSALREDFGASSDVDVLVVMEPDAPMTLEGFLDMRDELSVMFGGREVDLVEKRRVKNPYRRQTILENREVVYAR